MAAGRARQAHTAPTSSTSPKRNQIPRRGPREAHTCHIRHRGKMHSSAKQPNKHIIALSRRPPAVKTRLPCRREHVFQATANISPHRQRRPGTNPRVVGSAAHVGSDGPRMAAGSARQAHTAPANHKKRYQIPRRRPLQVHSCRIRHCGKMRSSAQQPNKHIIALSRRPPAVKTRLPCKREHVFQATANISPHRPRHPGTNPRVVGSAAHVGSDGPRMAAGRAWQAHTAPTNHQKR